MNRTSEVEIRRRPFCRTSESGQTLVFVPVVLLMITIFFGIMYDVAFYARQRIALQEQADSAALAAARVQGMMLESIAAGNDAIAVNVGGIAYDFSSLVDDPIVALKDIIERIGWIRGIQGTQSLLAGLLGTLLAGGAAEAGGTAAGADLIFPLPPGSGTFYGFSIKDTTPSGLYLNVGKSWYTAELFTIRRPLIPEDPVSSYPIKEKPVVIAFANLWNKDKPHNQWISASSASAVYFIPWGNPGNRNTMDPGTAMLCMMIPGPFWGARLDEVGDLSYGKVTSGVAVYVATQLLNRYSLQKLNTGLTDELVKTVKIRMIARLASYDSTIRKSFEDSDEEYDPDNYSSDSSDIDPDTTDYSESSDDY